MLDLQNAVALHSHLQRPPSTDDVPFPVRTVSRLQRLRKGANTDKLWMPPPDFQKIGLRNGLFPVAHPHIVTMRELQIARSRVAQLEERGGDVELQRTSPSRQLFTSNFRDRDTVRRRVRASRPCFLPQSLRLALLRPTNAFRQIRPPARRIPIRPYRYGPANASCCLGVTAFLFRE